MNDISEAVIGAAIAVHRGLGPGFPETAYEQALAIEFDAREIRYRRQHDVPIRFRERIVGQFRLDFLVADLLVVELKAVESLAPVHEAQVLSYLRATGFHLGLLINFNVSVLKRGIRRIVHRLDESPTLRPSASSASLRSGAPSSGAHPAAAGDAHPTEHP